MYKIQIIKLFLLFLISLKIYAYDFSFQKDSISIDIDFDYGKVKEIKFDIDINGQRNFGLINYHNDEIYIILNTDLLALLIWCGYKYKKWHPFIIDQLINNPPDLYLICSEKNTMGVWSSKIKSK